MNLEKIAIIFIIIVLPISIVLKAYSDYQAKTIELQTSYDAKLNKSTIDAVKAYQLNSFNEGVSGLTTSKMRNITASVNTFFTSLTAGFNMQGYDREFLEQYVPALVYTVYDGYYIYSKYDNNLTEEQYKKENKSHGIIGSTYQDGQTIYGIKSFVPYSCRYVNGNIDVVISYTLDNYITVQGTIGSQKINKSGYLIDTSKVIVGDSAITYKRDSVNITISKNEPITKEFVEKTEYKCQKVNGVKYYYDSAKNKWFSIVNGKKLYTSSTFDQNYDSSAYNYYKEAYEFSQWVNSNLSTLTPDNAYGYDEDTKTYGYTISNKLSQTNKNQRIFNNLANIQESNSKFNEHRLAIIRYTIEKNLSIAIKNYNHYGTTSTDFQMPKLNETEWDKIMNNVTMISFLQGLPIGGKIYNGCSVVANNKNDEVVTEESIYLASNHQIGGATYYYNPKYKFTKGTEFNAGEPLIGVYNVDLEQRAIENQKSDGTTEIIHYIPKRYMASYDSIVNANNNVNISADKTDTTVGKYAYNGNIYIYMDKDALPEVAKAYYTALARERYCSYKVNR